jgi:hypothetical protein
MTAFSPNKPVTTREPRVDVDAGLPAGSHTFELVVTDDAGNRSQPARVVVEIRSVRLPIR